MDGDPFGLTRWPLYFFCRRVISLGISSSVSQVCEMIPTTACESRRGDSHMCHPLAWSLQGKRYGAGVELGPRVVFH